MRTWLYQIFIENWSRKGLALVLSIIIWVMVHNSLTISRTFQNVPVKVENIPSSKTLEGIQNEGVMSRQMTLTLTGKKTVLDILQPTDLLIKINATGQQVDSWIPEITKANIASLNPDINLAKNIDKVVWNNPFQITLKNKITEEISVWITDPIGEPPSGYDFLDVWPRRTRMKITGPDNIIQEIKQKGVHLTFNLSKITAADLESFTSAKQTDVVSYQVPDLLKRVMIPQLSDYPLPIEDAKNELRIDLIRNVSHPLKERNIPLTLFFPQDTLNKYNPNTVSFAPSPHIKKIDNLYFLDMKLFAKGVSKVFLDVVQELLQISIIVDDKLESGSLSWSPQFISPCSLESTYISKVLSESSDDVFKLKTDSRPEYLATRFRNYMHRMRLYVNPEDPKKLNLNFELKNGKIYLTLPGEFRTKSQAGSCLSQVVQQPVEEIPLANTTP